MNKIQAGLKDPSICYVYVFGEDAQNDNNDTVQFINFCGENDLFFFGTVHILANQQQSTEI